MTRNILFKIFFFFGIASICILFLPALILPQKITLIGKINNSYKKNLIKLDNKPLNLSKFKGYSHKF